MEKRLEITTWKWWVFSLQVRFSSSPFSTECPNPNGWFWDDCWSNDGTIVPFSPHTLGPCVRRPRCQVAKVSFHHEVGVLKGGSLDIPWVVATQIFFISPLIGEDEPILMNISSKGLVQPPTSSSWFNNSVFFLEDGPRIQFLLNGVKKNATIDGLINRIYWAYNTPLGF